MMKRVVGGWEFTFNLQGGWLDYVPPMELSDNVVIGDGVGTVEVYSVEGKLHFNMW